MGSKAVLRVAVQQPSPDTLGATRLGSSSVLVLTDQRMSHPRVPQLAHKRFDAEMPQARVLSTSSACSYTQTYTTSASGCGKARAHFFIGCGKARAHFFISTTSEAKHIMDSISLLLKRLQIKSFRFMSPQCTTAQSGSSRAHQNSWSLDPRHLLTSVSGICRQSLPPKMRR